MEKTRRDMIIEGISHWESKDPGKWISSDVRRYVFDRYGCIVSNNYINDIRRARGCGLRQQVWSTASNTISSLVGHTQSYALADKRYDYDAVIRKLKDRFSARSFANTERISGYGQAIEDLIIICDQLQRGV